MVRKSLTVRFDTPVIVVAVEPRDTEVFPIVTLALANLSLVTCELDIALGVGQFRRGDCPIGNL